MKQNQPLASSGESWFLIEPHLMSPRPARTASDLTVRDDDPDVGWSGDEDEEYDRLREGWFKAVRWAQDRGVSAILASVLDSSGEVSLRNLGFTFSPPTRSFNPKTDRRSGEWLYTGDAMTETLEKLVDIPVVSFVAFNGSTDYIWVTDDSWYTLLLNEPGGSAALSAYGL
ncbi:MULTISPECIES: hypothetical protein [Microbacterium]|uniref:hypothetical protein n=1 Tax=Microbacterium TaxID=33882 RepID=UPI001C30448D